MWGGFGRIAHDEGRRRLRGARLHMSAAAGTLAVALLAALNPLIATAAEAPTTQRPPDTQPEASPPTSRVQLVVAGATVSGIAAVTGWLVLGGRRRERVPVRARQPSGPIVTLAPETQVDLELVVNRLDAGAPHGRYTGRVPGVAATTLWRAEDQRPRWIRRFEEQVPTRPNSARESDDEPMPWLDAVAWSALEGSDEDLIAR